MADIEQIFANLAEEAVSQVLADGIAQSRIEVIRSLDLRYRGYEAAINVPESPQGYAEAFVSRHRQLYGYAPPGRAIEIVAARIEARGRSAEALPKSRMCRRKPGCIG